MLLEEFNSMYRGEVSHLEILTAKCLEYVASKKLQTKEQNLDEIYKNSSKSWIIHNDKKAEWN